MYPNASGFLPERGIGRQLIEHGAAKRRTNACQARVGLGHGAGFVSGWLYWYFWIITAAIESIAGANILHARIPLPALLLGFARISARVSKAGAVRGIEMGEA
jgi:L-asparagine transporter-like permease